MGTSYEDVGRFLDSMSLKYTRQSKSGDIITGFRMKRYKDRDGEPVLMIVIKLLENGEYIEVFSPSAYTYKNGPYKLSVLQGLMIIQWKTKLIQFEYDADDGEVRPKIEFPLEDAKLTEKQLARMLNGLAVIVDEYDPIIRKAMETGRLEFPKTKEEEELGELMGALGDLGPNGLQEVLEEVRKRRAGEGGEGPDEL